MNLVMQRLEGCPHVELAMDRVRKALWLVGRGDREILLRRIDSPEEAANLGFRGSPTILVDVVDPFGGISAPVGYACRIYQTETGQEGVPSLVQLAGVLEGRSHAS